MAYNEMDLVMPMPKRLWVFLVNYVLRNMVLTGKNKMHMRYLPIPEAVMLGSKESLTKKLHPLPLPRVKESKW
ncbi:hypothetical protein D3C72_2203520 [compost metagenome]